MNTVKLIMVAITMAMIIQIAMGGKTTTTIDWGLQNSTEWFKSVHSFSEQFKSESENGGILQMAIETGGGVIEAIFNIPGYIILFSGLLCGVMLSGITPLMATTYATTQLEQIIWGTMGLIITSINLLLGFELYDKIVNKKITSTSG